LWIALKGNSQTGRQIKGSVIDVWNTANFNNQAIMFGNFGITEIILVLAFLLFLFGARKIPDLAKAIGKAIKDFRKEVKDPDP
jgi:sec-independent protein translocase protein TatA